MSRFKVCILGGSGFAGAELIRRILLHPALELVRVCAQDHVGQPLAAALPRLEGQSSLVFEQLPFEEAVAGADVVLMGLPHQASASVMQALAGSAVRVIDMSGAFRLTNADTYQRYYGVAHPKPELLGQFVYGLPELNRERLRGAARVASPGCFATSIELGLLPFAQAGLLHGDIQTVAMTGSSGAGASPLPTTHHPVRANNIRVYRPLDHQHTPEIEFTLREAGATKLSLSFVPVAGPLVRGILATSFFRVGADVPKSRLLEVLPAAYASERFVRVPEQRLPEVVAVAGSNYAEVGCSVGDAQNGTRVVSVYCALDNLVKGGAGQAIQNLNLMLGVEEHTTLLDAGPYP